MSGSVHALSQLQHSAILAKNMEVSCDRMLILSLWRKHSSYPCLLVGQGFEQTSLHVSFAKETSSLVHDWKGSWARRDGKLHPGTRGRSKQPKFPDLPFQCSQDLETLLRQAHTHVKKGFNDYQVRIINNCISHEFDPLVAASIRDMNKRQGNDALNEKYYSYSFA